ncbi:protein unc-79 homolog isoform X2 [Xenia sp. Carnegie-2017]|uniref:protein unc-79 homolog isoform X2 n=1 Tax=Xenia sp. Carnegie-2017 TaxID=2897299 RepID=UPI001F036F48|nr:protein unc-79 homolog isoform X2 [Xenia sp. Carnegie-2017]
MSSAKTTNIDHFKGRVHGLRQIFKRIEEETYPLPSAIAVTDYLEYFHKILLSLVNEDAPEISEDGSSFDHQSVIELDYTGLFTTLVDLFRILQNIGEGHEDCALTILHIMASLVPFLPEEWLNDLPITLTNMMTSVSSSLHGSIVNVICGYLLPLLLGNFSSGDNSDSHFALSCSSLIMSVLLCCNDPKEHAKFLETMMRFKKNVCLDLLAVMAYGPTEVLQPSVQLLFHYYPSIDVAYIFFSFAGAMDDTQFYYDAWNSSQCDVPSCVGTSTKLCIDAHFASSVCDTEPPVFLCEKCANRARDHFLLDIIQPIGEVAASCENKPCKGDDRTAKYTCFSESCIKKQRNRPLAQCRVCTRINHDEGEGQCHVVQGALPDPWITEGMEQTFLVDAIVRLLQQAPPNETTRLRKIGYDIEPDFVEMSSAENGQQITTDDMNRELLLSRFGVWLLASQCRTVSLCKSEERLGYLISVVFDWMTATADIGDKGVRAKIETLKKEYISNWLNNVKKANFELYCTCLSPDPPSYVQMQETTDMLSDSIRLLKEGLYRICCLIPYNLIPQEVWERIMPEWMNAIRSGVPPERLREFKSLLSDLFDPVVSPFKVSMDVVMAFIKNGFESGSESLQRQTLTWLQILSELDIIIKIHMLVNMFQLAMDSLQHPSMEDSEPASPATQEEHINSGRWSAVLENDSTLASYIMMLDIIAKQIKLQYEESERVSNALERQGIVRLMERMLDVPWAGFHNHSGPCRHCQMTAMWFQLAHALMNRVFSKKLVTNLDGLGQEFGTVAKNSSSLVLNRNSLRSEKNNFRDERNAEDVVLEQSDGSKSNGPGDDSNSQMTDSVFDTGDSVGNTRGSVRSSWESSGSALSFESAAERGPHIRFLLGVLKELPKQEDLVVILHLVKCLNVMCLRADYLRIAAEEDLDILSYLQEAFLVPNLWRLLKCDRSELCEVCVPVLLHCISLPCGAESLVNEVKSTFTNKDWRVRFDGVSKVVVVARYVQKDILGNDLARSALALSFAYLVGSLEDLSNSVSLHVAVMLETIHPNCLVVVYDSLISQFDKFPSDRLLIIHTFRLLHNALPKCTPLSGHFFLKRFTQLFVEKTSLVASSNPARSTLSRQANMSDKSSMSNTSSMVETSRKTGKGTTGANQRLTSFSSTSSSITICPDAGRVGRSNSLPTNRCGYSLNFERSCVSRQFSSPLEGDTKRYKFDLSQIESVDQMLQGAKMAAQGYLSPVAEENLDGTGREATQLEKDGKMYERTSSRTLDDEVTHQLVTLLCEFMSNPRNDNEFGRTQEYVISQIKHHVGLQMGYNVTAIGEFTGSPRKLRSTPVFSAFISSIPQVLDKNPDWGKEVLPLTLQLLLFCPAPEVVNKSRKPNYTLGILDVNVRHSWLVTLLIYLYKYDIGTHKELTKNLIQIVMNTINVQNHECSDEYAQKVGRSLSGVDDNTNSTSQQRKQPTVRRGTLAAIFGTGESESAAAPSPAESELVIGVRRKELELRSSSVSSLLAQSVNSDSASFGIDQLMYNLNKQSINGEDEQETTVGSSITNEDTLQSTPSSTDQFKKVASLEIQKMATEISKEFDSPDQEEAVDTPPLVHTGVTAPESPNVYDPFDSCPGCGLRLEQFDEETINLSIIVLATFVHRYPTVSTPWLLRILLCVGRKVVKTVYHWQLKSNIITPLSSVEIAKQFLRCVLVQFAPNGLFPELFRTPIEDPTIFPAIASALSDFPQFNQMGPISYVLRSISSKTIPDRLQLLLPNMAAYLENVNKHPVDMWKGQLGKFIRFLQKLLPFLPKNYDATPVISIMLAFISAANSSFKELLEPYGNVLLKILHDCTFELKRLMELCARCNDVFTKERNKLYLTKLVLQEILLVLRFKSSLPERTIRYLMQFLCFDVGTRYLYSIEGDDLYIDLPASAHTHAMDNFQHHISEALDFIKDWNFTRKKKMDVRNDWEEPELGMRCLGVHLKATISQLWAIELTKPCRHNKMYNKTLSWLKTPPTATQLSRVTLHECDTNIRLLSWLLIGSLSHTINFPDAYVKSCPIKMDESTHIAEFVLIILANFADNSQDNILGISALLNAFNLCLLWTLYCEHQFHNEGCEMLDSSLTVIMEFWARVTPGILHLLQHTKEFRNTVGEQFSHILISLAEWNAATLPKLLPLWSSVLNTCGVKVNDRMFTRVYGPRDSKTLFHWLKQNQLSMARTEQAASGNLRV